MGAVLRTPHRQYNPSPIHATALSVEALESRTLPATNALAGFIGPILESEPNDTIDQAQNLGDLSAVRQVEVNGTVGRPDLGAADVDWYRFTLDRPSAITMDTPASRLGTPLMSVLSLYGLSTPESARLPGQASYRFIMQDDGANQEGNARLARSLAAGTYFVAISGAGNRYFHPLIADSGFAGSTGDYELLVAAADLDLRATDGPAVLAVDPAAGTDLTSSPFALRIDLSTALNADSIRLGNNVQLRYSARDGTSGAVPLASTYFDFAANELRITPATPLRPGTYEIFLGGNRSAGQPVLVDQAGNPLGKSDLQPSGADYTFSFRVSGIKGNRAPDAGPDDTPATAQSLGELAGAGLVQVAGAIGNDPTNPLPFNPADVDLYHFHLQGMGRFAFTAEVFAGRIGSALDPALSLFRLDPSDHQLHFVASNDNSFNPTRTHDGSSAPLFTDPVLNAGVINGDYYLAVSASSNVPLPAFNRFPGTGGIFDPNVSHSGKNGFTIGNYVLNVAAELMNDPPYVSAVPTMDGVPLYQGSVLPAPPTSLSLTFDKAVNLMQMVRQTGRSQVEAIYIQGSQGSKYFPRFIDSSEDGKRAEFMMFDGLPNGVYQLHLSGALGLADGAGNPLVGNGPSGDYITTFTVRGPVRGANGNPRIWLDEEPDDTLTSPRDLGVLFPAELQTGIFLERASLVARASDTADYYRFTILQQALFSLGLNSSLVSLGIRLSLADADGKPIPLAPSRAGDAIQAAVNLEPGTYLLGVSGWSAALAVKVTYQIGLVGFAQEQAPPLSTGPGPAIRIRPLTGGPSALFEPAVPAGTGAGAGSTASSGQSPGIIPSGVFLRLAAGPIGGPGSTSHSQPSNDLYANILARTPDVLLSEAIASLPFLIPSLHSGIEQGSAVRGEFLHWLQTALQKWERFSWSKALELFYGSGGWQEKMRLGPTTGLFEDKPESARQEGEEEEQMSAGDAWNSEKLFAESLSPAWTVTAALALLATREWRRRPAGR